MSWLLFDLHGSVAAICPAGSTTLTDAYRYDGWGNLVDSSGTVTNPYRYRGLLNLANDVGAGALLAMGAREYSPQLGTFTQQDSYAGSAANPATMNRFLYALANPATLIDPDGHMACLDMGTSCTTSGDLNTYVSRKTTIAHQRSQVVAPHQAVLEEGLDTGIPPWALAQDPIFSQLLSQATRACGGYMARYDTHGACAVMAELNEFSSSNADLYCQFHVSECEAMEAGERAKLHLGLGATGMLPVVGAPANVVDAGAYLREGDLFGFGTSLISVFPGAGAVIKGERLAAKGLKWTEEMVAAAKIVSREADLVAAKGYD